MYVCLVEVNSYIETQGAVVWCTVLRDGYWYNAKTALANRINNGSVAYFLYGHIALTRPIKIMQKNVFQMLDYDTPQSLLTCLELYVRL